MSGGANAKNGKERVTLHARIRTLVVDDSPFMLKLLAQILKQMANFDLVGAATNGGQALRQVSALSPDLVLMDVHLPGLNGIQATQYIKRREHPPAVVIISSDARPITKEMAQKAGADGFLSKEGDLQHRLISVLEGLFGPTGVDRAVPINPSFQKQTA
jgi:DNA-binding NarL/FixJ family response regulator